MEQDRQQEIEEAFLNSLSFHTREFYKAQSQYSSHYVIRTLDTEVRKAYQLCLTFGIPHLKVAEKFIEDTPIQKRSLQIEAYRKILNPPEYRELMDHFGLRR